MKRLGRDQSELVGHIIGTSFHGDPVNRWVFQGDQGMVPYFTHASRKLYLQKGFGHVSDCGQGCTLWLGPNQAKDIPVWNSMDMALDMIRYGGIRSLKNGMNVDSCLSNLRPKDPHYYLFAIGVLATAQGKGLGGRLMREGLKQAEAARMPCYLESSKPSNVPLYEHFGFKVINEIKPHPDCPPLWLMWRDAI